MSVKAEGRTGKSIRNAFAGAGSYTVVLILNFAVRTALIKGLGDYYLGLNGVMTSLIAVFSLAELGMGSAINYSMYRPIATGDKTKVETYVGVFRSVYRVIGIVLIAIAFLVVPYLKVIVHAEVTSEVYLIYALFVLKTVVSYWAFAYRGSLLQANQEKYLVSATEVIGSFVACVGQMACFYILHNYIAGLVFLVLGQLAQNIVLYIITKRKYPDFNFNSRSRLDKAERIELIRNVYSLSIGKFSNTATNNVSGIIISAFVGLFESGYYSNYQMITSAITNLTAQFFASMTSSVGNLNVLTDKNEQEIVYQRIQFVAVWIYLTFSACMWTSTNAFMAAWAGRSNLLSSVCVLGMVTNQLTSGLLQSAVLFRDGCGLFYQGRYRPLVGGLLTVVLSVILVQPFGIAGVIWSAPISRTLIALWFDPYIVYKYVFEKQPWSCYKRMAQYAMVAIVVIGFSGFVCSYLPEYGFLAFALRGILTLAIVQIVWFVLYFQSDELTYLRSLIVRLLSKAN